MRVFFFNLILFNFTILYWFCHISTWICHGCTRVPNPEPPSHLPPRTIPLGRLSAPAPSIQCHASNLDWRFVSYMIVYMFQCHSPKSSHPLPLPQSPKDCSIHLCLFCCLAYRVIVTIFLNSIYMCWMKVKSLSRVRLCATPYMAAHEAPLSLGFSMQEHWSGLPFPSPVHESERWKWSCSVVSNS